MHLQGFLALGRPSACPVASPAAVKTCSSRMLVCQALVHQSRRVEGQKQTGAMKYGGISHATQNGLNSSIEHEASCAHVGPRSKIHNVLQQSLAARSREFLVREGTSSHRSTGRVANRGLRSLVFRN